MSDLPIYTAVLADDEPYMHASLKDQLRDAWPNLVVRGVAEDGPSALRLLQTHEPDVAFLDIRMPGLSGLQVAQACRRKTHVVFVTAFDNHAVDAFEADAIDYLLKPVEPLRLVRVVDKLRAALAARKPAALEDVMATIQRLAAAPGTTASASQVEWLHVGIGTQTRMIHVDDVVYFESDAKYTRVVAEDCEGLIRTTLKDLLVQLNAIKFVQTHRGTIVNRRFIRSVHRNGETVDVELRGRAERLKVSSAQQNLFRPM